MSDLLGNTGENLTYSLDCDFNINNPEFLDSFVNVFPNPSSGKFSISLAEKLNHISIYDVTGQNVFQDVLDSGTHLLEITKPGCYVLEINNQTKTTVFIF